MQKQLFDYKGTKIKILDLLEALEETILVIEGDVVVFANKQAIDFFGYTEDELLGINVKELKSVHETKASYYDYQTSVQAVDEVMAQSRRFHWIHKRKDDSSVGTEVILIPYSTDEGIKDVLVINDLSEWDNYKRAVELDRNLYSTLLNDSGKMMILIDPKDGKVLSSNSSVNEFYGMETLEGVKLSDLDVVDDNAYTEELSKTVDGMRRHFLLKHQLKGGEVVEISMIAGPVTIEGKTLIYAIMDPLDIDDESHVDVTSIMLDQASYRKVFERYPYPTIICDINYKVVDINKAFVEKFKFSKGEVLGKNIDEFITPLEFSEESYFFTEILQKGGKVNQDVVRKDRLNLNRIYRLNAAPIIEEGCIAGFLATYEDIDVYQMSMTRLKLIEKVYDNVEEGMVITDANAKIMWTNKAFTTITGYIAEEVNGLRPSVLNSGVHDAMFFENMWNELKVSGQWSGEITNRRKDETLYNEWLNIFAITNDRGIVTHYIGIMNDITKFKSQEERIKYLAYRDSLTGLYNRAFFMDEFERVLETLDEREDLLALLYFDIDDFKMINDTMGHMFGDEVLKVFAQRLRSLVDQRDVIARLGGDEFVIMLKNFDEINTPLKVAKRIITAFEDPVVIEGHHLELRSSIGIVVYPYDGDNKNQLMKNVDIAMYEAKKSNQTNVVYFSKALEEQVEEKYLIDKYIKGAVKYDELSLRFQGIVNTNDQRLASAEVLVRWDNPILGSVSPGVFIPIAEKNGTILELGAWVLKRAISTYSKWDKEGIAPPKMAINVSVVQLESDSFYRSVLDILNQNSINPKVLEFEITETVYMKNIDKIVETLKQLSELGISIVMDDFGTGYSSLSKLKMLKLSKLKIDRAFIYDLEDNTDDVELTSTIISMAKNLSLEVVAEGVESEHQLNFLKAERCDFIQGYLFYKPVDEEDFELLLREEKRKKMKLL